MPLTRRALLTLAAALPALPVSAQQITGPITGIDPILGIDRGQRFPDIVYTTEEGARRSIAESRGRLALVYFWASWCPVCAADLKTIQTYWDRWKDRPKFAAILLNFMDPYERGRRWAENRGHKLPFADSGIAERNPVATTTAGPWNLPRQTPLFFLLDGMGTVIEATQHQENNSSGTARVIEEGLRGI